MIKKLTAKDLDEDPDGCLGRGGGGGGGKILSMMPYTGYPVQSSGLHERVGISLVKVYKRVFKRAQKG